MKISFAGCPGENNPLLWFAYRCTSIYSLSNIASIPEERTESNKKVKVAGHQLMKVPRTLNARPVDDFPVLVRGVLKKFVLI